MPLSLFWAHIIQYFHAATHIRLNRKTKKIRIVIAFKHSLKSVQIRIIHISGPYFPVLGHFSRSGGQRLLKRSPLDILVWINLVLSIFIWSDGCRVQFWHRFVFQLTTLFASWLNVFQYYSRDHQGNGPVDGIGGCINNSIYRAVMSEKTVIHTPLNFNKSAQRLVKGIECICQK